MTDRIVFKEFFYVSENLSKVVILPINKKLELATLIISNIQNFWDIMEEKHVDLNQSPFTLPRELRTGMELN